MTYLELRNKIIATSHRKDLTALVPQFVDDARTLINERLGLQLVPLVADDATDDVLDRFPTIYFYAAMAALYEYIVEFETATYYLNRFGFQCDGYYITASGTEPLVIKPEGADDAT